MSETNVETKSWKKVLKIVLNVFLWLFVAFAVVVTVLAFAAQRSADGVPTVGGKCYLTVLSDSMSPTFKKGDLIVGTKLSESEKKSLRAKSDDYEGDVISFFSDVNGDGVADEINSHRIVGINYNDTGDVLSYITQGDNAKTNLIADTDAVSWDFVVAKWNGTRIRGLGGFLNFLQQPKGFLIVIVLPLVLFFLYEVFVFIKTFLGIKNAGKKVISTADEELIKQKAVEEYLKQQAAQQAAQQAEEKPSDPSDPPKD